MIVEMVGGSVGGGFVGGGLVGGGLVGGGSVGEFTIAVCVGAAIGVEGSSGRSLGPQVPFGGDRGAVGVVAGVKFRVNVEVAAVRDVTEGEAVGEPVAVLTGTDEADGVGDLFMPRADGSTFSPRFGILRSRS